MSKQYRWCELSGPVPYPDDSHRMLDSYDALVSGEGWAALAELGFVEEVAEAPEKPAKKVAKPKPGPKPGPKPEPEPEPEPELKLEPPVEPASLEDPPTELSPLADPPTEPGPASDTRTVSQMVSDAAAESDEEPATVKGKAKKVLSKRKNAKKKK